MRKILNLIAAFACVAFTLTSCADDPVPMGTNATTDVSSMTFAGQGASSQSVSVICNGDWIATSSEWIDVVPNYGSGNQVITISVADNLDTDGTLAAERKGFVNISVIGTTASIEVTQNGDPDKKPAEIEKLTVAEFIAAPESASVWYELTGTISNIKNTYYGNFDLVDETGSVYVYGLYEKQGGSYGAFEDLGLKEGDKLTLVATRGSYNGLIEAMNAYYVSHVVSLITIDQSAVSVAKEGGSFEIKMVSKGDTYGIDIEDGAKSWISVDGVSQEGDTTKVKFICQENTTEPREGVISFTSTSGSTSSTVTATVSQDGIVAIIDANIAEFLAAPVGDQYYRLQGIIISEVKESDLYGNVTIMDASGSVYVYGILSERGGESKQFQTLGLKMGDVITIVGRRAEYKGSPQVGDAYYESHYTPKVVTVKEFLDEPVSSTQWYSITAQIDEIANTSYGNFYLVDDSTTERAYVYGLYTGLNGEYKKFDTLGLSVGDKITIHGQRAEYKGSPQVGNAYFVEKL